MNGTILCTRDFHFDAGHRVLGHESKCAHLHGHRYKADVTVRAPQLDALGRVMDFGAVKKIIGTFIDEEWDHNMLLNQDDPLLGLSAGFETPSTIDLIGRTPYVMSQSRNPTAENIAIELYECAQPLLPPEIKIVSIVIHETPNCRAEFIPSEIPEPC